MKIIAIDPYTDFNVFHKVFDNIHKHHAQSIYPIEADIKNCFNRKKNKYFQGGDCKAWIVKDRQGNLVGRVAAFYYETYHNLGDEGKIGGIGFFESIHSKEVSTLLFNACKQWLAEHGMIAMDGPINFGSKLFRWGLLINGKKDIPFVMTYTPDYYQYLFEDYGFKDFYQQYCYVLYDYKKYFNYKRFNTISKRIISSNQITISTPKNQNLFIHDFCKVYNKAFGKAFGRPDITEKEVKTIFNQLKLFYIKDSIMMAYAKKEPVSFAFFIPDLNMYFKNIGGKLNIIALVNILLKKIFSKPKKLVGIIFGTVPEFQKKGIETSMFTHLYRILNNLGYIKEVELVWLGDFNPLMISIAEKLGFNRNRTLITYRYMIDKKYPFRRHPIIK